MFPAKKAIKALEVSVESSHDFVSARADFANAVQHCNEEYLRTCRRRALRGNTGDVVI